MSKKTWEQFYKNRGRYYLVPHENINKVISNFSIYKIKKVLDLGCGSGRHSILLSKEGFKLTGIDFSKEAIKLARRWAKKENIKPKFLTGDIHRKLNFKDNSFDGILAIDSLQYESTNDLKFTLKECRRILRDGGILFITLPTKICNPLVTHLIFQKEEIRQILSKDFGLLQSFLDKSHFLCTFAINNKK